MKGDIPHAAFKLLTELPVRTHQARVPASLQNPQKHRRALCINGIKYASVTEATEAMNMSSRTLYKLIEKGKIKEGEQNYITRRSRGRPVSIKRA